MKRRTSQNILKLAKKQASPAKQMPISNVPSDNLKAPRGRPSRKNRQFGQDITNLQKQPVFQPLQQDAFQPQPKLSSPHLTTIEPYLPEIEAHVQQLDDLFNLSLVKKLNTKSSDSTEITLEMRSVLIKWLLQVAEKFLASQETIHISIQIIDYILVFSYKKITKRNFQLLGIASLFVASKYNEIYTPEANKYVFVCDGLYTLEDLFEMESYILTLTNFNLQFPTLSNFIEPVMTGQDMSEKFKKTVSYLSKLIVWDFNLFNRFRKLHVTGGIFYLASLLLNQERFSAQKVMRVMDIDQDKFKDLFSALLQLYRQHYKHGNPNPKTEQ